MGHQPWLEPERDQERLLPTTTTTTNAPTDLRLAKHTTQMKWHNQREVSQRFPSTGS